MEVKKHKIIEMKSAEKENPTTQEKVNHVIKQTEIPQIRDPGGSVH